MRIYPDEKGSLILKEGDYGKDKDGVWWCRPPGGHAGVLIEHTVTEHEDGTITVSPSIIDGNIHCYLERGIWRNC